MKNCSQRYAQVQQERIKVTERRDRNPTRTFVKAACIRSTNADRTGSCQTLEMNEQSQSPSGASIQLQVQSGRYKVSNHVCRRNDRFKLCAAAVVYSL